MQAKNDWQVAKSLVRLLEGCKWWFTPDAKPVQAGQDCQCCNISPVVVLLSPHTFHLVPHRFLLVAEGFVLIITILPHFLRFLFLRLPRKLRAVVEM